MGTIIKTFFFYACLGQFIVLWALFHGWQLVPPSTLGPVADPGIHKKHGEDGAKMVEDIFAPVEGEGEGEGELK